jgi:hypothetical protein
MLGRTHRDLRESGGIFHARGPDTTACHRCLHSRCGSDSRREVNFKVEPATPVFELGIVNGQGSFAGAVLRTQANVSKELACLKR